MWLHMRLLENCNLKCKHCYSLERERTEIMDFDMYTECIDIYSKNVKIRGFDIEKRVMLSGGEPFLHPNFKEMLDYAYNKKDITLISILTNGILVPEFITFLVTYKDKLRVQISIEGGEEMDNNIRGYGHYKKALKALELLRDNKINYHISYTVSKDNMDEYKNIINLAKLYNSHKNNISPYIGDLDKMLSYDEWEAFKLKVQTYAKELKFKLPASKRACGWIYNCAAFIGGITINPTGSLTGCARDNRIVGNYKNLDKFYTNSGFMMHSTCMREKWKNDKNKVQILNAIKK